MMDQFQAPKPAAVKPVAKRKSGLNVILPVMMLIFLFFALVIWMNFPIARHYMKMDPPTVTPSVTPTIYPTRTPRPTFTPTVTATVTPTPLPGSSYRLSEPDKLDPPLVDIQPGSIVIKAQDAQINPPLSNPQWVPASKSMPGKVMADSYYTTFGPGSVSWKMDVALAPGLYQVYVMDTLYSSAGTLEFNVQEGTTPLVPMTDSTSLHFASSQSTQNAQGEDSWHSIGVFNVPGRDLLSVNSAWGPRDTFSLVAVDRVLIVPLPAGNADMLSRLAGDRFRMIVDDADAQIEGNPLLITRNDSLAWNGQFQSITNPQKDVKVTWIMPYDVPAGAYEVFFWVPGTHHTGTFDISILVNGQEVSSGKLPTVNETNYGNWVSMGTWDTPRLLEGQMVRYSVTFTVKGGTTGETGLDAIAFMGPPPGAITPTPAQ